MTKMDKALTPDSEVDADGVVKDQPETAFDADTDQFDADTGDDTPDFDPALGTLMGDVRDAMLMRIRTAQKPWAQMTEDEQMMLANGVDLAARDMVRKTVRLLTSFEWPHAVVTLGEVKIKGEKGIEAKIVCTNIEHNRTVLGENVGSHVMILMVDSETFMSARAPVRIDPDQPQMDLPEADEDPDEDPDDQGED